jgi:hypothetical protein
MKLNLTLLLFLAAFGSLSAQKSKTKTPIKESGELADYGGKFGVGVALGGIGPMGRFYANRQNVIDATLNLGVVILNNPDGTFNELQFGPIVGIGYSAFGKPFFKTVTTKKTSTMKLRMNGVNIRYNYYPGDYSFSRTTFGWAMETIRETNTKRSFVLELGLALIKQNNNFVERQTNAGLHARIVWNFFM